MDRVEIVANPSKKESALFSRRFATISTLFMTSCAVFRGGTQISSRQRALWEEKEEGKGGRNRMLGKKENLFSLNRYNAHNTPSLKESLI